MLTLITATLNAARFLDRAIASTTDQEHPLQHLVIDGGSSDETQAICARHRGIELIVEPGCSIYEAWNIGIARAQGEALMFLNADDELTADAVAIAARLFRDQPLTKIVAGLATVQDDDKAQTPPIVLTAAPDGELALGPLTVGVPAINAMAFHRSLFVQYGSFETRYRVAGDRAFLLRLALGDARVPIASVPHVLYRYHIHAGSLTLKRGLEQRLRIARDHLSLSRELLRADPPASAALWLRHMRQREAAVAAIKCLAAGRPIDACRFLPGIFV
jgi:glycosyltransferase involved in cell wall biosynthesis